MLTRDEDRERYLFWQHCTCARSSGEATPTAVPEAVGGVRIRAAVGMLVFFFPRTLGRRGSRKLTGVGATAFRPFGSHTLVSSLPVEIRA